MCAKCQQPVPSSSLVNISDFGSTNRTTRMYVWSRGIQGNRATGVYAGQLCCCGVDLLRRSDEPKQPVRSVAMTTTRHDREQHPVKELFHFTLPFASGRQGERSGREPRPTTRLADCCRRRSRMHRIRSRKPGRLAGRRQQPLCTYALLSSRRVSGRTRTRPRLVLQRAHTARRGIPGGNNKQEQNMKAEKSRRGMHPTHPLVVPS